MSGTDDFFKNLEQEQAPVEDVTKVAPVVEEIATETKMPESGGYKLEDFGDFKTIEEVKERVSKYSEVVQEAEGLRQKVGEFESKLKETQTPKSPYKNPVYFKLEQISEQDPDNAATYQKLVFGNPDGKELYKINFLMENPEYKEHPEAAQRKLERAFPALFDPDVDTDSQEYKDAVMDLDIESKKIRKSLMGKLDSIEVPDPAKEAETRDAKSKEFVQSWRPAFDEIAKTTKLAVNVLSEKDKTSEHFFDIELTPEATKKYTDAAAQFIVSNNLPVNGESVQKVKDFMKKLYIVDNLESYTTTVAEKAAKARDGQWRSKVHNPDPLKNTVPPGQLQGDESQELLNILKGR